MTTGFTVKSAMRECEVTFTDFKSHFESVYQPGDIIIADSFFVGLVQDAIFIDASEKSKEYKSVGKIIDRIIKSGFRKNKKIIAIGGGVIQDICGFISSVLHRGTEWVFYPTTLLSQGDSCIGGKSSINFGKHKNQLGTFNPPSKICIDTKFLETLPEIQMKSGFGEMAHYFIISSQEDFLFLTENWKNPDKLKDIIKKSLSIKKKFIENDEFDKNERQLLNYGHSFGHSIESLTKYKVPHGIAVAAGMVLANVVSRNIGFATEEFFINTKNFLYSFTGKFSYNPREIIKFLRKDKKNTSDKITLILTKGFGQMFKYEISEEELLKLLLKNYGHKYE